MSSQKPTNPNRVRRLASFAASSVPHGAAHPSNYPARPIPQTIFHGIKHNLIDLTSYLSPTESSIGHLVNSREQGDTVMEQAKRAGAMIVKTAQDAFWGGYHGYFQDPDGHLWEIA